MSIKNDVLLTAYCGLYCGDCLRYHSKASDLAKKLLEEFEATDFQFYADAKSKSQDSIKELAHSKRCCKVLEAIVALKCDESCYAGSGCKQFSCNIVKCCQEKGYQGCWECGDYENCEQFTSLKPFHGDNNIFNLRMIARYGLNKWTQYRSKFYIWQG